MVQKLNTSVISLTKKNKQAFLGNAAALLVPSTFAEPFGMVMIEALACGTPIIGLDSGAIPEVIKHGTTGVVVAKKNCSPRTGYRSRG